MIKVVMREEHRIDMANSFSQSLMTQVRAGINQDGNAAPLDQGGAPGSGVSRIG